MKWISAQQELPKEGRLEVLASNGHTVAPAWWVAGRFESFCERGRVLKWVTHWAKFPDLQPLVTLTVLEPDHRITRVMEKKISGNFRPCSAQ
jgi:hypothetical protein